MNDKTIKKQIEKLLDYIAGRQRLTNSAYDEFMVDVHEKFPALCQPKMEDLVDLEDAIKITKEAGYLVHKPV